LDPKSRWVISNSLCLYGPSALVKDQAGCVATAVGDKGDLGVHHFQETVGFTFREYLHLLLTGRFFKEVIAVSCNKS